MKNIEQLKNIKNNREYALSKKRVEYQKIEIQIADKEKVSTSKCFT